MSAFVVDPRHIDYIVSWAEGRSGNNRIRTRIHRNAPGAQPSADSPAFNAPGMFAESLLCIWESSRDPQATGSLLLAQNVLSCETRYPDTVLDPSAMPGTTGGVAPYRFRRIRHDEIDPAWVVRACDCLSYQSCETDDWQQTPAYAILNDIRESAIDALLAGHDCPWEITDATLQARTDAAKAKVRAQMSRIATVEG